MNINGIEIRVSKMAYTSEPARKHKHRRGQRDSYHRRIQKKWTKRFGEVRKPACYRMADLLTGRPMVVMAQELFDQLVAQTGNANEGKKNG